jgi:hypothetical protein
VVILTSKKKEVDLVNGYILGTKRCIQKPVDLLRFGRSVTTSASYWLLSKQSPVARRVPRSAKKAR